MWISLSVILLYATSLLLVGQLLLSHKKHASLILWTLWLLIFPPLGIPLYLILGTDKISHRRMKKYRQLTAQLPDEHILPRDIFLKQVVDVNGYQASSMTAPDLLWDGQLYYDKLLEDIRAATEFIHIQTYVWRDDEHGKLLLNALCDAVERGITVRIMADELGSVYTNSQVFKPFIRAGGHFSWYSTVQTRRSRFFFNLRNHRKINIIDGRIAYVGGMNMGDEYVGKTIGPWQDLQIRCEGSVLTLLENTFAEDWYFATEEKLNTSAYYPRDKSNQDELPVVVVKSGPDDMQRSYLKLFMLCCHQAQKRIDFYTPYFVPNETMLFSMKIAAQRGLRVRLCIPTLNEHMYMVDIGRAYYKELLEAGIEIYELHGMVHHAKVIRIDDDLILAGSHNIDIRSYKLNFELSLLFKHRETAVVMDDHFEDLFNKAEFIDLESVKQRPLRKQLKQGMVRLFGPVL